MRQLSLIHAWMQPYGLGVFSVSTLAFGVHFACGVDRQQLHAASSSAVGINVGYH